MLVSSTRAVATLRTGSMVPVPSEQGVSYQSVGLSITINSIVSWADGRHSIGLSFEDSSLVDASDALATPRVPASPMSPVIRSSSFSSSVLVREGQPLQFSVATDKISGETLKAVLTLTVLE